MSIKKITPFLIMFATLLAGCLVIAPAARAASTSGGDSKKISRLLSDAKFEARQLETDSIEAESYINAGLSWQSHSNKLNAIRLHINKTGELLTKLQNCREEGSPWQQKAIDQIEPPLKELVVNTTAMLQYFNDHKETIHFSDTYKEYLKSNSAMARELATLIADYVDYGIHKAEFERLGEKVLASER
ncbi:MAG TPA: hypothetical protein VG028_12250 [Terriglobia bacterium]|nr:hypothetical protein [Terriglobia bacterium]